MALLAVDLRIVQYALYLTSYVESREVCPSSDGLELPNARRLLRVFRPSQVALLKLLLNQHIGEALVRHFQSCLSPGQTIVVDAPGISCPAPSVVTSNNQVLNGQIALQLGDEHDKGEADFSLWLYAKRCCSSIFVILVSAKRQ